MLGRIIFDNLMSKLRCEAECDPSFKQLIPYVLVEHKLTGRFFMTTWIGGELASQRAGQHRPRRSSGLSGRTWLTPCSASWRLEKDQMSGIILRGYINSDLNEVDSIYLGIYTTLILTGRTSPAWRILERMTGQGQFIVGNKNAPYAKSMLVKVLKRINMFRYSHATVLHEPGIDNKTIQQCEGHASQGTTANIFIKGPQMMSD